MRATGHDPKLTMPDELAAISAKGCDGFQVREAYWIAARHDGRELSCSSLLVMCNERAPEQFSQ